MTKYEGFTLPKAAPVLIAALAGFPVPSPLNGQRVVVTGRLSGDDIEIESVTYD